MSKIIQNLISELNDKATKPDIIYAIKVIAAISEEQAESAEKMERHTRRLVWLTWALLTLTVALLIREIVVNQDSHTDKQSQNQQPHLDTKQP